MTMASIGAIATGIGLMVDDYRDIDLKKLSERVHHFHVGLILALAGMTGVGLIGMSMLSDLARKGLIRVKPRVKVRVE